MNYADLFRVTLPETALEIAALLVLVVDLAFLRKATLRVAQLGGGDAGCGRVWCGDRGDDFATARSGLGYPGSTICSWHREDMRLSRRSEFWSLTVLTLFLLIESDFTRHVGEFVAVVLMAATGGLLIAAAQDLLVIFVGLELLSLGLYILTAFAKQSGKSAEGGDEVLPVRRYVGGVSSVWFQLSLRTDRIDKPAPDHARDVRPECCQCDAAAVCVRW